MTNRSFPKDRILTGKCRYPGWLILLAWTVSFGVVQGDEVARGVRSQDATTKVKTIRSIEYARIEQTKLLADVYLPEKEGPLPTVLMVHGGAWFAGDKAHVTGHARHAARSGYAVVAVNYRLAPRFPFPAQLDDLNVALRWIDKQADSYGFDRTRVAAYGYSAGAHLASLLALSQNSVGTKIQCVVAGGAPCEFSWVPLDSQRLAFWLGGSRREKPDAFARASPTTFVTAKAPAFFFFHGTRDSIVPISSARKLHASLTQHKVDTNFHVVEEAGHLQAFMDKTARTKAIQFLDQHLMQATE